MLVEGLTDFLQAMYILVSTAILTWKLEGTLNSSTMSYELRVLGSSLLSAHVIYLPC